MLKVKNISKTFEFEKEDVTQDLLVLKDVSFEVRDGEFFSLIGPSGCGKSTLFQIIGGLLASDTGTVLVDGRPIDGAHRDIGMVFQEESTFPWRTVLDNVAFPLEIARLPKAERLERARRFVRLVGLDGFQRRFPDELSARLPHPPPLPL